MKGYSVYQRKDGRYEGRIQLENADGKRKYKSFFGRTTDAVAAKMAEFRTELHSETCISITFSDAYAEWFDSISIRVKKSTLANYTLKAEKHILPVYGGEDITSIQQNSIYQFIRDKQDAGLSNRYITDILVLMKSVFKYAARTYHIPNPMDGLVMPKKQQKEIRLLTEAEEQKLMQIVLGTQNLTTMGIALAKLTGLRIGELCALKWSDIDLEKRILTVRKTLQRVQIKGGKKKTKLMLTDPKSGTSKRTIPIPECMIEFLRKFQGKAEEFLLSGKEKPVEPRTMQYRFATILKNGNLPSVHFHALRHMFASTCVKLGFDIKSLSEILGHSGVEITLNRYVHSSFEQKAVFMNRLKIAV